MSPVALPALISQLRQAITAAEQGDESGAIAEALIGIFGHERPETREALSLALTERMRQIDEKGYTAEHDDGHGAEELATAACCYLLPPVVRDADVAWASDNELHCEGLQDYLREYTFVCAPRAVALDSAVGIAPRVGDIVTGIALGLAELERLLRLKRFQGGAS